MPYPFVVLLGKSVRYVARLRGGGSALPGLFVEKIDPQFIKRTLDQLPHGVILVSGTNGKTTTTKMIVTLLEAHGLRVFTNRTGSNFTRGVAAALLKDIDIHGTLHADIAVLELDEAHAVKFVEVIKPRHSLFLNVMRDQLDRFGEIDATAHLLRTVAAHTTETVTLNREDSRIRAIADMLDKQVAHYFGLSDTLLDTFPSDDDMRKKSTTGAATRPAASVLLDGYENNEARFIINGKPYTTPLKITGIYNVFNAAAALAVTAAALGETFQIETTIKALATVTPAFGRGETISIGGQPLELVLVKNPSGFRLGLQSFEPAGYATMIAINDDYADGRDMSWLWDVDFDSLVNEGVAEVSGIRAYDMALRLQYDEVPIAHIEPDLSGALRHFIQAHASQPKRIYCTYTAMLALRRELSRITKVEVVA